MAPSPELTLIQSFGDSEILGTNGPGYPKRRYHYSNADTQHQPLPLVPLFSGTSQTSAQCYRKRVNSDLYAIELIETGTKIITHQAQPFTLKEGDVYFIRKGESYTLDPQTVVNKRCVAFDGPQAEMLVQSVGLDQFVAATLNKHDRIHIADVMKTITRCIASSDPRQLAKASQALYGLLLTLSEYRPMDTPDPVRQAIQFMHEQVKGHTTLDACSDAAGVSPSTLKRLFAHTYHTSPIAYFLTLKVNAAKRMLRHSEMSIGNIATQLGYSSTIYFSNEFKKRVGVSPRAYRKA